MVEKFREILQGIEKAHGEVYLFAILQMDEFIDKWSVIISAPWINSENRKNIFEEISNLMAKELNPDEINSVARLGIFPKDAHLITELLKYKKDAKIEGGEKINGNVIHKGHILESNSDLETEKKEDRKS